MQVVKKINNNVVVCLDQHGEELVAFGKGLGFPKVPYELVDMSKVSMTFYKLNYQYYQLLKEIPTEIFDLSAAIVDHAQKIIPEFLNPNIIFSLADHINFAITRLTHYQGAQLPFSYDVEQLYPKETAVGYYAVKLINRRLDVELPVSEVTAIAMHFVNSQTVDLATGSEAQNDDDIIKNITKIIEQEFEIIINQTEFTYNRFVMHLRYYIKRMNEHEQISENDNSKLFNTMKKDEPQIYLGAKRIADYVDDQLETHSNNDEIFYLMIYVKRIVNKELNYAWH
ncbi:PRD domain-containing protein [Lactobacillus pentosus]|jgi:transcriptional antiterminator|uniref:PRD domain-containing protein n=1 Tax=Lactiplantibacillus pentosus TaxID=1589 RepID=UPI00128E7644|nr:PRD domain-containing protein [Lactiplantibacillus pentosus]MCH4130009.1 PRD domain-containing protein [Lactiplantibacillus sp.]BBM20879.1 transcription antiterminator [Lactiplantibacillus plantarum]MCT3294539.1 PRD domain-containing protein [Lactiplantibacillus pentosus]MPQ19833.1 PRD domain-containing protein [Lactiplantibacillus pentosus]UXI98130.1 PRD domain-containing protein [Lactiplantibacillus pentosus]